jgi:CRP/FNR family transcriptional regulator
MAQQPRNTHVMAVPRGTILFRAGDDCPGFVIVHAGTVKVSLTAENGREIVLYRVRPGDVCLQTFGCLVKGGRYSAEGLAETDLAVEMVPVDEFQRRVADDEDFRTRLFTAVAARFADLEQLVEDVALSSISARLARALLRLADGEGVVNATHEALATEIGSAREVVSRQLGVLMRAGLIAGTRGHIALLHPDGLRALASEMAPV